ncbi:MAG: GTP-binding protein [Phycisphaerae bacterium]|nr:GTP-binding protein [Phycisphaerae bacterium]
MIQKKICMVGAFAVGKTSLVNRFVRSMFSEKYHTTVGVKVDKKELTADGKDVTLVLWDLAGEDEMVKVRMSYLRGASGYLLVVDGTRSATLDTALMLRDRVENELGKLPFVLVCNKADLSDGWEIDQDRLDQLRAEGVTVLRSSAKTGEGVEEAFASLAAVILE